MTNNSLKILAKSFFEVLVIFNDDNKTPDQALKSF